MKSVIIALIIGSATVFGSIVYTNHLEKISVEMIEINKEIEKDIILENFEEASKKSEQLSGFVREKRTLLDAVGNHQELDEIERNLSELVAFTEENMRADALSKCYSLDFLIKALPRNFKIKIENIL